MIKHYLNKPIFKYAILVLLVSSLIVYYQKFDLGIITNMLKDVEEEVDRGTILLPLLIFFLRSISIVIPIIPGTYCAVIAGYLYGMKIGLPIIFFADFCSCSSSFFISRRLGKDFVRNLLGANQMKRIEIISRKYLENNFFLMTGLLMTSWFDFVCYAVGLTNLSWKKFMPALIISIFISDMPFVAGGYTLSQLKEVSFSQVLSGNIDIIKGPYLILLILSALIIFSLGILNAFLKRSSRIS
tara:strand:- start:63 stop:788 length:726 start_codon:yes stop_codon:yes gene_type:complete